MRLLLAALIVGCTSPEEEAPPTDGETPPSPTDTGTPGTTPGTDDTAPVDTETDTGSPPTTPSVADLSVQGSYSVNRSSGRHTPSCDTPYELFVPSGASPSTHVVLSHGFSRNKGAIEDLALHFASWGVPVATHNLCHATPFDNDPDQDALDLLALSDLVGGGPVIYAGHSAGGLRSVLAGAEDPDTVAVLGLDLVDLSDLALDAAPSLTVPVYGLLGEADACNADANGAPVYAAASDSVMARVTDADHCDFEAPTDILCTFACEGPNPTFADAQIREVIRGMATGFLVWQAGVDAEGADYWTPGRDPWDALVASGRVTGL